MTPDNVELVVIGGTCPPSPRVIALPVMIPPPAASISKRSAIEVERASAQIGILAYRDNSGIQICATGVAIRAGQSDDAGSILRDAATTADHARKRKRGRPVKRQYSVIQNITRDASGRPAIADL